MRNGKHIRIRLACCDLYFPSINNYFVSLKADSLVVSVLQYNNTGYERIRDELQSFEICTTKLHDFRETPNFLATELVVTYNPH